VYVACFLALVGTGFLLMARHVSADFDLKRLLLQNAVSTFCLFLGLQFCDVGTWVADWNVNRWLRDPWRTLDVNYLTALGARGWPALQRLAQAKPDSLAGARAREVLRRAVADASSSPVDWRSAQLRRDLRLRATTAWVSAQVE
jgi:hypothetical protein